MLFNIAYDASVNSAPAGFKATVAAVAQYFQNLFTNPITINIDVGYGEINGQSLGPGLLGESLGFLNTYSYSQLRNALSANALSADQASAAASLPANDPTNGGHYWVAEAEAKALGLLGPTSSVDGFVGFSSTAAFTYNNSNGVPAGQYDFYGIVAHEFSEVMGRGLLVGGSIGNTPNSYEPLDLFHYSVSGVRDFAGNKPGYFSIDGGVTNLANFNTNPNGDFGDWAASAGNDSFLAFSNSGVVNAVSQTDIRELNILGYDLPIALPPGNPMDEWEMANGQWAASVNPGSHAGSGWQVAGIGDFNGDGTSDVLWFNSGTGDVDEWLMANGKWVGGIDLGAHPGSGWQIAGIGDFNKDGTSDVLWFNSGTGQTDEWQMANGQWAASVSPGTHPGSGWQVAGIGDFNRDGTSDVLWYNTGTGDVDEWLMANGKWAGSVDLGAHPGSGWKIAGIGDFNKDGTSDVLWYNSGTGQTDEWQMANGQWAASVSPGTHPGSGWQVAGIGDFNNDGTSDVLWYNTGTGGVDEWLMANGKWAGSVDLGVHPGSGWQIAGIGDFNKDGTSDVLWQQKAS